MYGRAGLNRFQKAQTLEPFSVAPKTSSLPSAKAVTHSYPQHPTQDGQVQSQPPLLEKPASNAAASESASMTAPHVTQVGGGQSTWQPPDWAIEPRTGVYYLEVMKDGEVLDRINLDKKRHIFGRQFHTCDFVLDHQSVSRQHAAVVPHKNGRFDFFHLVSLAYLWLWLSLSIYCIYWSTSTDTRPCTMFQWHLSISSTSGFIWAP